MNPWITLAIALATLLAYASALRAPYVMGDDSTIAATPTLLAAPGSAAAGRPVLVATLAANSALNRALGVDQRRDPDGPNKAVGFRLVNLLLHLLTGALLFGVIRRSMRERTIPESWRAIADPVAGFVSALWLLHPIQSEVLNYIVQRSEALASLCCLGVLYASTRSWDATGSARRGWYALAVIACVLGMGSKEIVISAPLAVMLYDRAFRLPSWRALARPGNGRGWLYLALWGACIASFAVFEAGARGDTAGFHTDMPWYRYICTQCWAIAHHLRLVAWPSGLAVDYGFKTIGGVRAVPGLIILSTLGATTLFAWSRVERFDWLAFAGSCFFIVLAPSSSIVPIALEVTAERRIYLALAAVLVMAVVAAESLRRRIATGVSQRQLGSAFAALAGGLAVTTAVRSRTYANAESLWRGTVWAAPDNPCALDNLGWALYRQPVTKLAAAESAFTKAMALDSTCHFGCVQLATVLVAEGRLADAVRPLELAVARDSGYVPAERDLALVLMKQGVYDRAIPHRGARRGEPSAARPPRGTRRRVPVGRTPRRRDRHLSPGSNGQWRE